MKQRKEQWALFVRAMRETQKCAPHYWLVQVLTALCEAARPFPMLWFGAAIVDELTTLCRPQMLLSDLAWGIGLTLAAQVGYAALMRYAWPLTGDHVYGGEEEQVEQFLLRIDYEQLEDPAFQAKLLKHREISQNTGGSLYNLHFAMRTLFLGVFQLAFSIALAAPVLGVLLRTTGDSFWQSTQLNWCMAGILLVCIVLEILFNAQLNKKGVYYQDQLYRGIRIYTAYEELLENYHCGKELRLFHAHRLIHEKTDELLHNFIFSYYKKSNDEMRRFATPSAVVETVLTGCIYLFLALKAMAGLFSIGNLVKYVGVIQQLVQGISSIGSSITMVLYQLHYVHYYFDIIDTPNVQHPGTLPVEKRDDHQFLLAFEDVSFRYPGSDTFVLRHFSATFRVGERLAVVGPNGSGKSTMIKLLCRLYDPQEGRITLNGIDIRKYNIEEYRTLFSVVFQDFRIFSLPIGENVASGVQVDEPRAVQALRQAGLGERLQTLPNGLHTLLYQDFEEGGVEISGGEAQKIAFARALYKDAPFIILDEPTAALDPLAEAELYQSFNRFVGDRTAIYISHRLSSCRFCDKILVFDKGEAVQSGTHESLLAEEGGLYHALWNAQAQYYIPQEE
ncbi:MAG TPA: ABC transporter ATP-binding protein [Candidatus Fimivicinus intestinavium]|nr:ABC transporter ATP-binding protein [Candidatus Fimivicinus intestinavium]